MNNNLGDSNQPIVADDNTILLGLGGNIGDVEAHLRNALKFLVKSGNVELVQTSSVYETPPWGIEDQPVFMNMCVEIRSHLKPVDLLELCQDAELSLNRERTIKWGPRTIDIDILLMGSKTVASPRLTIPHPRISERAFVLVPLAEIVPDRVLEGRSIASWAQSCSVIGISRVAGPEVFDDVFAIQAIL